MNEEKRKQITDNENLLLYNEVNGLCPLCLKRLTYKKKTNINKGFQVAHIYPLNPTAEEIELLKNEEKLSVDVNDLDNLIALCGDCHRKFDNPRTIEDYRRLLKIKREIIQITKIQDEYHRFPIENEIKLIIENLANDHSNIFDNTISYDFKEIDEKDDGTLSKLTKRRIKNDVSEYFLFIKELFSDIDRDNEFSFDTIACQIKAMNTKLKQHKSTKEEIYEHLADWLNQKTGSNSKEACKIIIAYFVQNCEALS